MGGFEIWKEEADLMKLIINFKHIFHIVGHDKKIISKKCLPLKQEEISLCGYILQYNVAFETDHLTAKKSR